MPTTFVEVEHCGLWKIVTVSSATTARLSGRVEGRNPKRPVHERPAAVVGAPGEHDGAAFVTRGGLLRDQRADTRWIGDAAVVDEDVSVRLVVRVADEERPQLTTIDHRAHLPLLRHSLVRVVEAEQDGTAVR